VLRGESRAEVDGGGAFSAPQRPGSQPSALSAGTRVGRYEILRVIGSGGMGMLYRARDPNLGRDIALKLLHAGSADSALHAEGRGRIHREAQLLARLSHPNVVAAYDIGTYEGAVFMAMEFVEGVSMRDWLAEPRILVDALRVLIAAGRGLVAAHATGVLHRDFKPANVMVSSDGRVRVIDFGLARLARAVPEGASAPGSAGEPAPGDDLEAPSADSSRSSLQPSVVSSSNTFTRPGAVMGTPGYISPEQLRGEVIDHKSDQFSYAVTVFVALTGQKPYPDIIDGSQVSALGNARTAWPRSVPRRLRSIVDRGLALRPEHRHPSLAAMVNALERIASQRKQGTLALALGGAFAVSVALPGALPRPSVDAASCNVDAAMFRGVWDPAQRERVERAFHATEHGNASEAFELVSRRLDGFESQWLEMRRESCEATLVRGEQPERVMALRATCLDRALEGTKALIGALGEVSAAVMNRISEASPASLAACSNPSALLGVADQLPTDPAIRAKIDELEVGLAVNRALVTASRGRESVEQAQRILELARATNHLPAIAAASVQLGRATYGTAATSEQRSAGEALLNDGLRLAAAAKDDQLLARTASFIFYGISYGQTRIQEAEAMLPAVEALVHRAGDPPGSKMELLIGKSTILGRHNKIQEQIQALEETMALAENVDDEFKRYGITAATDLGHVYADLHRYDEAEAIEQRAADGIRRRFGANHPRVMSALGNLSTVQAKAGHRELALASIAEYRRLAATMPPDEPRLKFLAFQESRVWRITGDCARAVPLLREALVTFSASDGPDHPWTTNVMSDLGVCLAATDHVQEGISFLERVLANRRSNGDAALAEAAFALAKVLWSLPAQRVRALALTEEARSFWLRDGATGPADEAEKWLAAHRR
jgi:tetratricopeptide (TPR) repeat protein/predicted Ser/Thr protein kinase